MKVEVSDWFKYEQYPELKTGFKIKLADFIKHVTDFGLENLEGRNKSSDDVDTDNHNFVNDVKFAQDKKLWHYHIGIPSYDKTNGVGDYTSDYIIHYQKFDSYINIVHIDNHPFKFPEKHMFEKLRYEI